MLVNTICIMLLMTDFLASGLRPIDIKLDRIPEYSKLPDRDVAASSIAKPMYTRTALTGLPAISSVALCKNPGRFDSVG